jgi:UDP-glucose 4-epimerase
MVDLIRAVSGTSSEAWAEPVVLPRRSGDPARVVASADVVRNVLGWQAEHDVEAMVRSAWEGWCSRRPVPSAP